MFQAKKIVQEELSEREEYLRKGMEEFDRYVCDTISGQGFKAKIDIGKVVFVTEYDHLLRRYSTHDHCYDIDIHHKIIDPNFRLPIFGERFGTLSYHPDIEKKKPAYEPNRILNYHTTKPFRKDLDVHCYMISLPKAEVWDRDLFYMGIHGVEAFSDGSMIGAIELACFEPTFLIGSLRKKTKREIALDDTKERNENVEKTQHTKLLPPGWCPGWVYGGQIPFAFVKTSQLIGNYRLLRDKRKKSYLEEECFGSAVIYNERGVDGQKLVYKGARPVSVGAEECVGISRLEFRELIKNVEQGLTLFYEKEKWKASEPRY